METRRYYRFYKYSKIYVYNWFHKKTLHSKLLVSFLHLATHITEKCIIPAAAIKKMAINEMHHPAHATIGFKISSFSKTGF